MSAWSNVIAAMDNAYGRPVARNNPALVDTTTSTQPLTAPIAYNTL